MTEATELERPSESAIYVAGRLQYILDNHCQQLGGDINRYIKAAIDLLRWYDWDEEQKRRRGAHSNDRK